MTNNVVALPLRPEDAAKNLRRRISVDRTSAIDHLRDTLGCLVRIAGAPGCGHLVIDLIPEYESVLSELLALDPAAPPEATAMRALARRLEILADVFSHRLRESARTPPAGAVARAGSPPDA